MLDEFKLWNALLYVLHALPPTERKMRKVLKILWFADIASLKKAGDFITGDRYVRMQNGPVPHFLYNALKGIEKGDIKSENISVHGGNVEPLANPDFGWLSPNDMEALTKSIYENRDLTANELSAKSHGLAWNKTEDRHEIHWNDILDEIEMPEEHRPAILENYMYKRITA